MWRLIQDFFRQNWIMRGVIALGWLSVLIMVASAYVSVDGMWGDYCKGMAEKYPDRDDIFLCQPASSDSA